MSDWPSTLAPSLPAVRAALLDHAAPDAERLGLDADAYGQWLRDALADPAAAGEHRRRLAARALERVTLPAHVQALCRVAALRRTRVERADELTSLAAWGEAEVQLSIEAAHARIEDPQSPRNRLAALGKAAGTLGHELRNPLGVIQSSVYLLGRRGLEDHKARRHLEKIGRQAANCSRIIEDLMHLARNAPPRTESLDVAEAFALAQGEATLPASVACTILAPPGRRVQADAGLLQRALVNLLHNAATAMRAGGSIEMGLEDSDAHATLWVRDHGPGFEPGMLEGAFDPLATTSGVGLGLALVDSIMRRHGGRAQAQNAPDGGARITLAFPRETAQR